MGPGHLHHKISRYLMRQHTTPTATTDRSPTKLLMGRQLRTTLDCLHPSYGQGSPPPPVPSPQRFSLGDPIYAQNFRSGDHWLPGFVTHLMGPCSYRVQLLDGWEWRRHIDHLRWRSAVGGAAPSSPANLADSPLHTPSEAPTSTVPDHPSLPTPLVPDVLPDVPDDTAHPPSTNKMPSSGPVSSPVATPTSSPSMTLRHSERSHRRRAYLKDYVCAVQMGRGVAS